MYRQQIVKGNALLYFPFSIFIKCCSIPKTFLLYIYLGHVQVLETYLRPYRGYHFFVSCAFFCILYSGLLRCIYDVAEKYSAVSVHKSPIGSLFKSILYVCPRPRKSCMNKHGTLTKNHVFGKPKILAISIFSLYISSSRQFTEFCDCTNVATLAGDETCVI